jgi:predicted transcriptional regulator of viral defense system
MSFLIFYSEFYYLCGVKDVLDILGSVPVTKETIASLYPDVSGANQKVSALERSGRLLRLKKGLYVVNPEWSGRRICTELVANHLYTPSYVSMHTALRWYGLIPERVSLVQSMTIKHSRKFENSLGSFTYTCVDRDYFPIGLRQEEVEGMFFVIASPEKALCDLICSTAGVNLRYKKEAETFLEQDLRLDMDALRHLDASIFQQCAAAGKKTQTIMTLLKLLEP